MFFFFFSSRRRHTRYWRDWSSDVCSSDLLESIGTLAGGIAHDLNNTLTPILMSIDMLREFVTDQSALGLLATLQSSAQRGANLVQQVLSFARGVDGQRITVNPLHLMRELHKVMHETFPKSIDVQLA